MNQTDYEAFYDLVVPRLFEVAEYQKLMCGKLDNLGKTAQSNTTQTDIHGALSYLDQFTQDYLLVPIYQAWPNLVPLVEEDTGLKRSNLNNLSDYAIIMDPIDGTAFYLRGDKDYSIMLGLMNKGEVELGIICYPEKDLIIAAIKGQGAWIHRKNGTINKLPNLEVNQLNDSQLSCHYRFKKQPYTGLCSNLSQAGYTLSTNDDGFGTNATGILQITNGESGAFIAPHISLHDFAAPAFIVQELGGVVMLYHYNGLDDASSWSDTMQDYGRPNPTVANPRYRVIIADSNATISKVIALMGKHSC